MQKLAHCRPFQVFRGEPMLHIKSLGFFNFENVEKIVEEAS